MLQVQDLGWHLTSCHAPPHMKELTNVSLNELMRVGGLLIDQTWGFAPTDFGVGNDKNRTLNQGRLGIERYQNFHAGAILPFIQVEVGMAPFDILRSYAQREGFLINVGKRGDLIIFRPRYNQPPSYGEGIIYRGVADGQCNNVIGSPRLRQTIDGLYSKVDCWSTILAASAAAQATTDNPNYQYLHDSYTPEENPLPFFRLATFMDQEAVSSRLRLMRAKWKQMMDHFNSWEYTVEVPGHSRAGDFFASDTMIQVVDTLAGLDGLYYVQRVSRSLRGGGQGARTRLTLRLPWLLDPALQKLSGGAQRAKAKATATNQAPVTVWQTPNPAGTPIQSGG
jgi:prophage tail gpP-like protein